MTQVAARPLRADARRNRERVLNAARAVFAEQGYEAQMDDVARRAEVGVGTVYRHFPTKEALIDAIVAESFERMIAFAEDQLANEPDPWEALEKTLWAGAEIMAGDRAVTEVMTEMRGPVNLDMETQRRANAAFSTLIERAKAAGALRSDVLFDDVGMVMCGIGSATCKPHVMPDAWRRHTAIIIDGLRASSASAALP
jgi:AcrR family transcriptional regulator